MNAEPGSSPYLILFDMDGTLIDGAPAIVAAMDRAFAAIGRGAPEAAQVRSVIGLDLDRAMLSLAPDLSQAELVRAVAAYREAFVLARRDGGAEAGAPIYPGMRGLLERLSSSPALLGVATGKARRGLDFALEAHGLGGYFATLHCASDGPGKPHPAMIERAMAFAGAERSSTVMVGDATYDMEMAKNAGVWAIGVSWGYHTAQALEAAGAVAVIDSADALEPALDRLWGRVWRNDT